MPYNVRWLKDGSIVAEERFDHLQDAKDSAAAMLPFYRNQGATYAIVTDDDDVIYLRIY